jgi:tRNA (guanine37-N1)-methyltransferase
MKRVYEVGNDPDKRVVLLSETHSVVSLDSILDKDFKKYLESIQADPIEYLLDLTYEHLSVEEILTNVLPSGVEIPSSYEQVGHIAHLNLRDQILPFKEIIGQVLLDKNPSIRTVVNKIGSIETEFRTFPMEVIAGESKFEVTVRESGANFHFNFQNVYWNSRLQMEHSRMIDWIREDSLSVSVVRNNNSSSSNSSRTRCTTIIADMMAGVGPFAVPLAMGSSIQVHANGKYVFLLLSALDLT